MIVLGAGHAGLLAAAMLRKQCKSVVEAKPELPDNHSAVLRFRSSIVGDTIGVPMKRVLMVKSVEPWLNPIADAMHYSKKTTGGFYMRSVLLADGKSQDRFIAPDGFTQVLANCVSSPIDFGIRVDEAFFEANEGPFISTLPMNLLMTILKYDGPKPKEFPYVSGQTITAQIQDCEAYCSLYIPNPNERPYRISITGANLIIEVADQEKLDVEKELTKAKIKMGIYESLSFNVKVQKQTFMKILPIDENIRKRFILWATERKQVYSLGRFATWRPGLMLDELVTDVRVIQRLVSAGHNYDSRSQA